MGVKTLSGRKVARDPLQSSEGCVSEPSPRRHPVAEHSRSLLRACGALQPTRSARVSLCRWAQFTAGWLVGGIAGVGWAFGMTQARQPRRLALMLVSARVFSPGLVSPLNT